MCYLTFTTITINPKRRLSNQLLSKQEMLALDLNASVKYGKRKYLSKNEIAQNNVIAAKCLAPCNKICYRKTELMLKILYSKCVTISAKRKAQLNEFCEFVEFDSCSLLHVMNRRLSLLLAKDKLLKSWEVLKSYFQSLND